VIMDELMAAFRWQWHQSRWTCALTWGGMVSSLGSVVLSLAAVLH
jgi:hypothetical protein